MRTIRNNKGFTLIELMIVVVIIGILAAIAIPKFSSVSKNAKQSEAESILKQIYSLEEQYMQRNDTYAANITDDAATGYLTGWKDPQAQYFTFPNVTVSGTGTAATFCANATPVDATVVEARSIDHKRNIYAAAGCTGTILSGPDKA
jgi:prepilin-type N-terminal cleavage/methylation domain-containing protein